MLWGRKVVETPLLGPQYAVGTCTGAGQLARWRWQCHALMVVVRGAVGTARRRRLCETHGDMEPRGGLDCALAMSDQLTGVAVTLLCRPFQSSCVAPAVQLINDQLIHDYE